MSRWPSGSRRGLTQRLADNQQIVFFRTLHRAAPGLSSAWWALLVAGGLIPALLSVATGAVVDAIDRDRSLLWPLAITGALFTALQAMGPIHLVVGQVLGHRTADAMNRRLLLAATGPPGISHLEDPERSTELSMARDFDLGITGPPLHVAMSFIASGLRLLLTGLAAAAVLLGFAWWAPLVLVGAWGSTHWLLAESGVWKDRQTDEVRRAQRHADYAYQLAVDAPAAKELRLFGLADWVVDRFADRRRRLFDLQWEATRLRERSVLSSLVVVAGANALVFWRLSEAVLADRLPVGEAVAYLLSAVMVSAVAFGGLNWALDAASAPALAVGHLAEAFAGARTLDPAPDGPATRPAPGPQGVAFRGVTFTYPRASTPVLDRLDLEIEPGTSLAIVGRNGAGKTTLAKLLCRFYDPDAGRIEVDGRDLRSLDVEAWRTRVAAVFQDFVRWELPLRDNVAPRGAPDEVILGALAEAGAGDLLDGPADLDTPLARGYPGGTDLSGGQWQRVALARAICGVRTGAGLVLLDEPTAQLDVRGEAEIFRRLLAATRDCTTIVVSHRFSTVRLADRIAVVEGGRVVEQGSHGELMAAGGRYHTMYELQASRFAASGGEEIELDEQGKEIVHEHLS